MGQQGKQNVLLGLAVSRREGAEEILCEIKGNYDRMPPALIKW